MFVCGLVNAKNGFGAYVGDKFYLTIHASHKIPPQLSKILTNEELVMIDNKIMSEGITNLTASGISECIKKMDAIYG